MEKKYTIKEVAEKSCLSESTIRKDLLSGVLKGYKKDGKWIIYEEQLNSFIDDRNNIEEGETSIKKVILGTKSWNGRIRIPIKWIKALNIKDINNIVYMEVKENKIKIHLNRLENSKFRESKLSIEYARYKADRKEALPIKQVFISIPIGILKEIGVSKDNKEVKIIFENETITIQKYIKKQ